MTKPWHPRGEVMFPDWRTAEPGTRVEHVRSGRTGTVVRPSPMAAARARGGPDGGGAAYLIVDWDDTGFGTSRGRVVAPAFDLRRVDGA